MPTLTKLFGFASLAVFLKALTSPWIGSYPFPMDFTIARPTPNMLVSNKGEQASGNSSRSLLVGEPLPTSQVGPKGFDQIDVATMSTVPEEPTALMLLSGLSVIVVMVRRRRHPANE